MELWFFAALGSALGSGFAAFIMKIGAQRGFHSESFIFYSGISSIVVFTPVAFVVSGFDISLGLVLIGLITGAVASVVGVFKIAALRYIDTTIYYPLFKLVSPALATLLGIVLFSENFSGREWIGLFAGMFVPLLLITKSENSRQNNLYLGIIFVLVTGFLAAVVSALNKYGVDLYSNIYWLLVFNSIGIVLGSFLLFIKKNGIYSVVDNFHEKSSVSMVAWAAIRGIVISLGFLALLYAFLYGGSLGVVYTIQSLYILIPIILSIIFYNEHWNLQKIVAIILSVASLALLG